MDDIDKVLNQFTEERLKLYRQMTELDNAYISLVKQINKAQTEKELELLKLKIEFLGGATRS